MTSAKRHLLRWLAGVALALAAACAVLAGSGAWALDAGAGGSNSLTVSAAGNPQVSVYQIATAAKDDTYETYHYTFTGAFSALAEGFDERAMNGAAWAALAERAAGLASGAPAIAVPAGEALTGLTDGLYLVLAPVTATATVEYTYSPAIVALPNKAPLTDDAGNVVVDEDGFPVVSTAADGGPWLADATVSLKSTQAPLYGSICIEKTVEGFSGEPATFVFRLSGRTPAGATYENYASIYFTSGNAAQTVVTHIPAGTVLTVEEVYSSARYEFASGDDSEKTIVSAAAVAAGQAMASAAFSNRGNESGVGGHGIENNFELGANGDWNWTATPQQARS